MTMIAYSVDAVFVLRDAHGPTNDHSFGGDDHLERGNKVVPTQSGLLHQCVF